MTCAHVLGLIDAGPFAGYPRAHLDAAWQHARQCATCGPALEAAMALTTDLAALPLPTPPPDLAAAVLSRVARLEQAHSVPAVSVMADNRAPSSARDWSPWATTVGGLGAGLAITVSMLTGEMAPLDIMAPKVGGVTAGLVAMRLTTTLALVLAASLALYVAGLFASLGGKRSITTN